SYRTSGPGPVGSRNVPSRRIRTRPSGRQNSFNGDWNSATEPARIYPDPSESRLPIGPGLLHHSPGKPRVLPGRSKAESSFATTRIVKRRTLSGDQSVRSTIFLACLYVEFNGGDYG